MITLDEQIEWAEQECKSLEAGPFYLLEMHVAILATLRSVKAEPVAWVLVPKEPTNKMLFAADDCANELRNRPKGIWYWEKIYSAMLAAAPAAPRSELLAEGPSEPSPYGKLPDPAPGREG